MKFNIMSGEDALTSNENYDAIVSCCLAYASSETNVFDFMATIATMLDAFSSEHELSVEQDNEIFEMIREIRKTMYEETGQF